MPVLHMCRSLPPVAGYRQQCYLTGEIACRATRHGGPVSKRGWQMATAGVIGFKAMGPETGLETWPAIPAASIESGDPVQRGHLYVDVPAHGLSAGIWDCTPFIGVMEPYPVTEFMLVLDGQVTIIEADGKATVIAAGESFILPKGLVCKWHQPDYMRKYFVILDDPAIPAEPAAKQRVIKLDHDLVPQTVTPSPGPEILQGGVPQQHGEDIFVDASGQLTIGIWDTTPYHRIAVPFPRYEFMHFLEGAVSMTTTPEAGAQRHLFQTGESMFITQGTQADFKVESDYLRKIFVIFIPSKPVG
jgi:uncharacterized cupin superfamily protein